MGGVEEGDQKCRKAARELAIETYYNNLDKNVEGSASPYRAQMVGARMANVTPVPPEVRGYPSSSLGRVSLGRVSLGRASMGRVSPARSRMAVPIILDEPLVGRERLYAVDDLTKLESEVAALRLALKEEQLEKQALRTETLGLRDAVETLQNESVRNVAAVATLTKARLDLAAQVVALTEQIESLDRFCKESTDREAIMFDVAKDAQQSLAEALVELERLHGAHGISLTAELVPVDDRLEALRAQTNLVITSYHDALNRSASARGLPLAPPPPDTRLGAIHRGLQPHEWPAILGPTTPAP
ncbi:hypothetical protein DIPPA_34249 [Diplonema papillatum]|nr:hypothetical protein DIPPA_34249 [Diplonema papillatum]|eukprot:gene13672-21038_t